MCQFSSCHPCGDSSHVSFRQLSPKESATIQGGWWSSHLNNAQSLGSTYHFSSGHGYGVSSQSFSSAAISPIEESVSTYGYSYGYGTDF